MYTVIETDIFVRAAAQVWTDSERVAFIDWLAANPDAGDVIPGSGGCRKVNAAARGSFISIAWRAARWLLMVYVKAKFDNLPVSFLKQLREAIDHG
ncbi:MAG: transcriptional regulator [Thiobacillus sp.]